jgi:quinol monooxygenase YgiN
VDNENPNQLLLTERWSSKEDWDAYFAIRMKEIKEGGFFSAVVPLIEEDGLKITFSEIEKSL